MDECDSPLASSSFLHISLKAEAPTSTSDLKQRPEKIAQIAGYKNNFRESSSVALHDDKFGGALFLFLPCCCHGLHGKTVEGDFHGHELDLGGKGVPYVCNFVVQEQSNRGSV